MKTPRELLLQKHQAAMPKLDEVRMEALRAAFEPPHEGFLAMVVVKLWRELFLPSRRIWAGLAAAWLLVLGFNIAASVGPAPLYADMKLLSPETMLALQTQRSELAKLMQPVPSEPAEPPRQSTPPRTDLPGNTRMV